jgi:tRNASer (uridine44-2'-O)-methyltransferase
VQNITHPKFVPTYLPRSTVSPLSTPTETWITPLSAPAYFDLDVFHSVLHEMAHHPEQNSSLILRAEPLSDEAEKEDAELAERLGLDVLSHDRVRFIPRQPRRDARLDQRIVAFSSPNGDKGVVVKTPLAGSAAEMPFYHPPVRRLAFLWDTIGADEEVTEGKERCYGTITVAYLAFPDTPCGTEFLAAHPKPPRRRSPLAASTTADDAAAGPSAPPHPATVLEEDTPEARAEAKAVAERRLQRTCLALLERLHKHGHGSAQGYVKRVVHDVSHDTRQCVC